MAFDHRREINALGIGQHAQHGGDKDELPNLYTHVECEQRERNVTLRQTDFRQRAGEAESVQQPGRRPPPTASARSGPPPRAGEEIWGNCGRSCQPASDLAIRRRCENEPDNTLIRKAAFPYQ
jgi:hypothetical protein